MLTSRWLKRSSARQEELRRGVDSDLIQQNRIRFRNGLLLLLSALALRWLHTRLHFIDGAGKVSAAVEIGLSLYGAFLLSWWWQQTIFLDKPDAEKPPSMLDGK